MKKFILTIGLIASLSVFSQEFKPGKVSQKELSESAHPLDASAPAAVLYKAGTTSFDFDEHGNWITITDVTARIKIYKKEGYGYATVELPMQEGSMGNEEVTFMDAVTYNLEGGKTVAYKLENKEQLIDEPQKKRKVKKITLPNVKDGSVLEYRYIIKSPYITSIPDWYFQYAVPANFVQYDISIPQYFVYNRILSPYLPVEEKQESRRVTRIYTNTNPRVSGGRPNVVFQGENGRITFFEAQKVYTARNVPALADETYVDNIKNYQLFVKHELASAEFPGSPKKDYTATWDAVAKYIYNEKGFGDELARKAYFEKDVDAILSVTTKREEVITAIFEAVKNRMAWNGQYGYNAKKGLNVAYQERSGSVAEINLMLISMLRYAGFTANPVLLSTRDKGHLSFVGRNQFNYVIAGVESQNGIKFLDATNKSAAPGILPLRALNGNGRIVRENLTSEEVSLLPSSTSKENISVVAKVAPDGVVTGHVKKYYFDYDAFVFRENFAADKEKYLTALGNKLNNAKIKDFSVVNDDSTKPVLEDFNFESSSLVEAKGGKLYISPMLLYTMSQNPFKHENRSYPIDFNFPQQEKYTFSVTLPEGYVVESLPEPAYYQIKDNVGGFRFNISTANPGQVQVMVTNDINYAMINADYYPAIKEFFSNVVKKQGEKIVLKKL